MLRYRRTSPQLRHGRLWSLGALLMCILLGVGAGEAGTRAAGDFPGYEPPRESQAAPHQRWGSAKPGQADTVAPAANGAPGNTTVPQSLRARYPLRKEPAPPAAPGNKAEVAPPPDAAAPRGFDAATSREVPAERDVNRREYVNTDGTRTTEYSTEPVNYRRPDGSWAPIDPNLVATGDGWRTAAAPVESRLAARANAGELARIAFDGAHVLSYGLAGAAASPGEAHGATATYRGVLPDTDLELTAQGTGVKETLVLRTPAAPRTYVFPLALKGLHATNAGGRIVLTDTKGHERAVIPAGSMTDAADDPATSTGVTYRLVTERGRPALKVTLDETWLRDPARRYPVRMDPSVEQGTADGAMIVHGGSSRGGGSELLVGRQGGESAASYLKFDGLSDKLRLPHHLRRAAAGGQLRLRRPASRATVTVHPVTASWTAGTDHRYPGPAVGGALTSQSFAHGYIGLGAVAVGLPGRPASCSTSASGRPRPGAALGQRQQANNGLSLRASATDGCAWKKFAGTATANPPRLYVTHSAVQRRRTRSRTRCPNPAGPAEPGRQGQGHRHQPRRRGLDAGRLLPGLPGLQRATGASGHPAAGREPARHAWPAAARSPWTRPSSALPPGKYFLDFTMVQQRRAGLHRRTGAARPARAAGLRHPAGGAGAVPAERLPGADADAAAVGAGRRHRRAARRHAAVQVRDLRDATPTASRPTASTPATSQARRGRCRPASWRGARPTCGGRSSRTPPPRCLADYVDAADRGAAAGDHLAHRQRAVRRQDQRVRPAGRQLHHRARSTRRSPRSGRELRVVRTYNSLDPRRDLAFGAGWIDASTTCGSSRTTTAPATSWSPTRTVSRCGSAATPDGTYAAPLGPHRRR